MSADGAMPGDESWPYFGEDEIAAVSDVLRSGRVNQWTGDKVKSFERAFAERFAMPYGIALANGTLALELALRAFGIGPGDEVVVTSSSFVASASCISLVGGTPVFADVDRDSQNVTAGTIEPLITPDTKAAIPVHLAGWPVDIAPIMDLAEKHSFFVIEDCAQAHGAEINGEPAGSLGHAAAFSFCQDKIMTTGGEGGMLLLRDDKTMKRAWEYKDHGKSRDKTLDGHGGHSFRYVHDGPGSNWRMTEMQAAIGLKQLEKLDGWLEARRRNTAIWARALGQSAAIRLPQVPETVAHARYRFCVFLNLEALKSGATRDDVLGALRKAGIDAGSGFCPEIYRENVFSPMKVERRPVAHELGQTSLMFKVHPTLDPDRLAETAQKAREIIAGFEA